jgi:hypothetical protein
MDKIEVQKKTPEHLWKMEFDERQRSEIEFCRIYARDFRHGTDGHNAKMIIARMAQLLDELEDRIP